MPPARTDVLVVTHRHLDHSGDATAIVEAMTKGGFGRRGTLLAPRDALENEPVVFRYAQAFVARRDVLAARSRHELAPGIVLETPLAHDHGVEMYGYRLSAPGFTAGHVVDTCWLDALPEAYAGVDLLVVNATRAGARPPLPPPRGGRRRAPRPRDPPPAGGPHPPRLQLVRARPDRIALGIAERTGVPTAARDGWLLALDDLAGAARAGDAAVAGARAGE